MGKARTIVFLCLLVVSPPATAATTRTSDFKTSWNYYRKIVLQGAGIEQRIEVLERIMRKYGNLGANLARVAAERHFLDSWKFYLTQVKAGASDIARLEILDRIIDKYRDWGVDLSVAEKERAVVSTIAPLRVQPPRPRLPAPAPVQAPPPAPAAAPRAMEERPVSGEDYIPPSRASTRPLLGFGTRLLGEFGSLGYEAIYGLGEGRAVTAGIGTGALPLSAHSSSSCRGNTTTYSCLMRFGKGEYFATGFLVRTLRGEAGFGSTGETALSGGITNYGIPFVLGIETRIHRNFFFNIELAYTTYFGDPSQTRTAVDPISGQTAVLDLAAPKSGARFGIGLGFYLF